MRFLKSKSIQYCLVALIAILIVQLVPLRQSILTLLNLVAVYAIAAIGYNILLGYAGQISLGHAAFMGLGAYCAAFIVNQFNLPFLVALIVSGVIPMLVGLLLGLVALRLEGFYLAIATAGFGLAGQQIFREWIAFTNGFGGVKVSYATIFGYQFRTRQDYFMLVVIILVILAIFSANLLKSKTGRALIAMRDSVPAAQAMGVSLFRQKLFAFALSAFCAGISGCLYLHLLRFSDPSMWGSGLSMNLLAMVVIGGLASIGGSICGAAYIVLLPEILKSIPLFSEIKNFSYIFNGIFIIVVMVSLPRGIVGIFQLVKYLFFKFKSNRIKATSMQGGGIGMNNILSVRDLTMSFGGLKAVDGLSMDIPAGSIFGLIGPNGAGKTTAFNCISRFNEPDRGEIIFRPTVTEKQDKAVEEINLLDYKVHDVIGTGLARTFQNVEIFWSLTVMENIILGIHCKTKGNFFAQGLNIPSVRKEEKRIREKAQSVMEFLGIAHLADQYANAQPYGIQKLIELARALLSEPKLLILDEPAAGMDQTETEELSKVIKRIKEQYGMTILMVEHDMSLVMDICDRICVINFGKKLAEGTPTEIQNNPAVQEAYLGKEES